MRIIVAIILFFYTSFHSIAQKKSLDFSACSNWPAIGLEKISNNGKFLIYTIFQSKKNTLVVQSTDNSWKQEIQEALEGIFTENSRWLIYNGQKDSIGIFDLIKHTSKYIANAGSFSTIANDVDQWLCYISNEEKKSLVLLNLETDEKIIYKDIVDCNFQDKQILFTTLNKENPSLKFLFWINPNTRKCIKICEVHQAGNYSFDKSAKQLVFLAKENFHNENRLSLRYYNIDMDSSITLIDTLTGDMNDMRLADEQIAFNDSGDVIFFKTEKKQRPKVENKKNYVTISSYNEDSIQFKSKMGPFLAVMHLKDRRVIQLQKDIDRGIIENKSNYIISQGNYVGSFDDYKWRVSARPDIYLISTWNGERILLKKRLISYGLSFSTGGKYVIWYDREIKHWFTYNISLRKVKNITSKILVPLYFNNEYPDLPSPEGIVGWTKEDKFILIYDRNDIWQVDPEGIISPINITHSHGVKNHIKFKYIDFDKIHPGLIDLNDTILLSAFNLNNRTSGFFKLLLNKQWSLKELVMEPIVYSLPAPYNFPDILGATSLTDPIKASNAVTFIVKRMTATEYPNLYSTNDFIHFTRLTNLAPQKLYNWYTTELIRWKLFNGKEAQGILYKPENFNSSKKYPIIFYYYEKNSYALNLFIHPKLSNGIMSIPWFVSHGYLVFVPDICYTVGYPGLSAYNYVVSAAKHLFQKTWVDKNRAGLQGHSFGGFETNYIIAQTNIFSAAASSAGFTNLSSAYGQQWYGSMYFERRQGRINSNPWRRPDRYIKNSPIFKADMVSTPLLLMHNKNDAIVSLSQADEWYNCLKRLGKKVWLLSYENEGHILRKKENQLDYSLRLSQFFDHYLKRLLPPDWMTISNLHSSAF
jgi:hypothetical protein